MSPVVRTIIFMLAFHLISNLEHMSSNEAEDGFFTCLREACKTIASTSQKPKILWHLILITFLVFNFDELCEVIFRRENESYYNSRFNLFPSRRNTFDYRICRINLSSISKNWTYQNSLKIFNLNDVERVGRPL